MTAIADAIRAKTGTTGALTLDGMAAAIAALETGGSQPDFTFTPSTTGSVKFLIENPENIFAVMWLRTDKKPYYSDATSTVDNTDTYECVGGITIVEKYVGSTDGKQDVVALYNYSDTYWHGKAYTAIYSLHTSTVSSATNYGAAMIRSIGEQLSFYVNSVGAKGLRVGGTYAVYLVYKSEGVE